MAKNKPAFPSSNNKSSNGQESKGDIKTPLPTPKKTVRGNSRGQ
ncbi:hypothetical protein [Clostridium estertheticum]|nr:hypothetical protein [Clostridium estertheticum]